MILCICTYAYAAQLGLHEEGGIGHYLNPHIITNLIVLASIQLVMINRS